MKHAIAILRREIGVSEARLAILKMDGVADEIPDVLDEIKDMRAAIEHLEPLSPPLLDPAANPDLPGLDADIDESLPAPQACRDGESCESCQ